MRKKTYTHNGYYGYINNVQERALSNPEWFWSDNDDASQARQWLHENGASAIIDEIYDNTPDEIRRKIDNKKLTTNIGQKKIKQEINDTRNDFAQHAATQIGYVSAIPALGYGLLAAPVATAASVGAGFAGSMIGNKIGDKFTKTYTSSDGTPIVTTHAIDGALIGGTIGGLAGGIASHVWGPKLNRPQRLTDFVDDISWNRSAQDAWRKKYHRDRDVDAAYDRFVNDGIIESNAADWYGHDHLGVLSEDDIMLGDYELDRFRRMFSNPEANSYGLVDAAKNLGIDSHTSLPEFNSILNNAYRRRDPNYKHLNLFFNWDDYRKPIPYPAAKSHVVDQVRQALDGIRFVRNNQKFSSAPSTELNMTRHVFDSGYYHYPDIDDITIGHTPPGKYLTGPKSEYRMTLGGVAAHETGHSNPLFNTYASPESATPDSPRYHHDYSRVPDRTKQLLKPTNMNISNHDVELAEGYSDLWAMKYNMRNIKGDSDRKYNYLDLLRYKLTPVGRKDRFIQQRGGWWKGWKQQLDALNEVYKNGGELHVKK